MKLGAIFMIHKQRSNHLNWALRVLLGRKKKVCLDRSNGKSDAYCFFDYQGVVHCKLPTIIAELSNTKAPYIQRDIIAKCSNNKKLRHPTMIAKDNNNVNSEFYLQSLRRMKLKLKFRAMALITTGMAS
ncbi:hypothetical protein LAZ67_17001916 [Cordylochernes scorpioides]|uniref:Uncharacterized protein n=1 Tax=Cordylochernes scorpioides TaxID=51811 RepID=A0ABY6LDQ3_9ARAC|nr:hypothetical protein LAZ67_17001916 [Cordylochernes scorpioides]